MNKKGSFIHRVGDFLAGKGFYIVLFLCVAVIGVSAWAMIKIGNNSSKDLDTAMSEWSANAPEQAGDEFAMEAPKIETTEGDLENTPDSDSSPEIDQPAPSAGNAEEAPESTVEPKTETMAEIPVSDMTFVWPLKGDIIVSYSTTSLIYDQTMADWRAHKGIDIAADLGSPVMTIAAGTVESVYEDDLYGMIVAIDHGNDLKSVYANLAATPTVAVGDKVSLGEVLGAVGDTAIIESGIVNHLHLEVLSGGTQVDPMEYLPEM